MRTSCVPILKMWRNRRGKRKRWRYSRSNLSQRKRVKVVSLLTFISRIQFLLVEISFHVVWKLIHFFRYTARVPRLTLIKSLCFLLSKTNEKFQIYLIRTVRWFQTLVASIRNKESASIFLLKNVLKNYMIVSREIIYYGRFSQLYWYEKRYLQLYW